jgi:hypothetical protein
VPPHNKFTLYGGYPNLRAEDGDELRCVGLVGSGGEIVSPTEFAHLTLEFTECHIWSQDHDFGPIETVGSPQGTLVSHPLAGRLLTYKKAATPAQEKVVEEYRDETGDETIIPSFEDSVGNKVWQVSGRFLHFVPKNRMRQTFTEKWTRGSGGGAFGPWEQIPSTVEGDKPDEFALSLYFGITTEAAYAMEFAESRWEEPIEINTLE